MWAERKIVLEPDAVRVFVGEPIGIRKLVAEAKKPNSRGEKVRWGIHPAPPPGHAGDFRPVEAGPGPQRLRQPVLAVGVEASRVDGALPRIFLVELVRSPSVHREAVESGLTKRPPAVGQVHPVDTCCSACRRALARIEPPSSMLLSSLRSKKLWAWPT